MLGIKDHGKTRLDMYMIVYLLQIPIFIIARLPVFCLFEIATCCCDKGYENAEDVDQLTDRVIHYDFVQHESERLHNFQYHPRGRAELEFNRNLEYVRQQSVRRRQSDGAANGGEERLGESLNDRGRRLLRNSFQGTIYQRLSRSKRAECVFCYEEMADKDKVIQLKCYDTHQFHEECYNNFVEHFEKNGQRLLCPLCRAPVDKNAVIKKVIQIDDDPAGNTLKIEDAFGIKPNVAGNKVVDDVSNAGNDSALGQLQVMAPDRMVGPPQGHTIELVDNNSSLPPLTQATSL